MNGYGYLIVGIVVVAIIALLATNKKFVETLKNIYKIEELRKRILYTLGLLLVYRLGCFVVIPGINPNALGEGSALASQLEGNGLLGLLNVFSGGAFGNAAIFALGVMPYITASIIIQLMGIMIPYFQKMQKEGESGRRKMNQWTRFLTIGVLILQGPAYIANLYHQVPSAFVYGNSFGFVAYATTILIAGTMFIMWLGEKITDKGIGNGISLMIFAGIVARWSSIYTATTNILARAQNGEPFFYIMLPLLLLLALVAVVFVVVLTNAERRIPVQYAKRVMGRKMYGGQASYIPIKVNMTGVMPIIFASTLCSLPGLIFRFINLDAASHPALYAFFSVFNYNSVLYLIVYVLLIVAFNYFYVAIQYNPVDIANQLRKNNGTIPGIRPGKPTSDFITKTLSKITLIGAIFLAIVAGFPIILGNITGTSIQLGGTTLLIVVGVALETGRSLEGYMTARYHKGFLE